MYTNRLTGKQAVGRAATAEQFTAVFKDQPQGLLAITSQNRISAGIGVVDVLPGMDIDLFAGRMLEDSEQLGDATRTSIESYWIGTALTWRFGRGSSEELGIPDRWSGSL